jgi:hypothetical protein
LNSSGWAIAQLFEGGASRQAALERAHAWGANGTSDNVKAFIDKLESEKLIQPGDDDLFDADVEFDGRWVNPTFEKHREPLQRVMVSAFDPTLPLAE